MSKARTHARERPRQWFKPGEVAKALGVSKQLVSKVLRNGRLSAIRTGPRAWHVTAAEVQRFAREYLAAQARR